MNNTITITKEGRYYKCRNYPFINDSWFHHEKLEDVKNYYIERGYNIQVTI